MKIIKRALVSVYNKEGILELSRCLIEKGIEIIATGGTHKYLSKQGISVKEVSELTHFKEMLDGRVKTLHPLVQGGILAIRDNPEHMKSLLENDIVPIDMVVVNLYPFFNKSQENISLEEKVEFIDIGGPAMIRAAGKNFKDVIVVTDINDYEHVMENVTSEMEFDLNYRKKLAGKAFNLTAAYDAAICNLLLEEPYPRYLPISYEKKQELRYGENPHQSAAFYVTSTGTGAMKNFTQLSGKELSYNNIKDMDTAWKVVNEFEEIVCCAVKHNSPCGVAIGTSVKEAYTKAYQCDPISIFGGIVAFNNIVDLETSKELINIFLEVVIAPDFSDEALETLKLKKNLRILKCHIKPENKLEFASVDGGILVQERDIKLIDNFNYVTEKKPSKEELSDLVFSMKVVKHVKSNAIVVARDGMATGIGGGQVNRIWAAVQALDRSKNGVVLASDAFFPFEDVVEESAKYNIKAIAQSGGSIKDKDSVDCCNKHGIAMVLTGIRHFKH